jgi:hypothetical protein
VNVDTGEFRALGDEAAKMAGEYRSREAVLIKTVAWLVHERPDLEREAERRTRPRLRAIEGGGQ